MSPANTPLSTSLLASLVCNGLTLPLIACDANREIVFSNPAARSRLQLENGAPLAQSFPALAETLSAALDHNTPATLSFRDREGHELYASLTPLNGPEETPLIAILVNDTTPTSPPHDNQDLAALTHELRAIIDSSSDGLFVCDAEANVIRMNPASEKIHQLNAKDIIGRNMRDLIGQGFIDRSAALEASLEQRQVSLLQNKDGRKLISIGTPVFDEEGRMIRVVVSERDITEIDRLQRDLEHQEAVSDQYRHQMLEMQQLELDAQPVIARSPSMIKALQQARKVAEADSSVLILGESGVGKGLLADIIHRNSQRANRPLIKINCGAIPESLIEAELFGYEKGAFTGAQAGGKPGQFELANGGTLFLDEIAELPLASQVKLLRFLEDGRSTRLGGTEAKQLDVRVLAATHRNLEEMVEQGGFRLDLYYRLNVIPIAVPALRERRDCLIPLIRHYINQFATQNNGPKRLSRASLDAMTAYPYPGNVRELMNICERLVVMTETELIDLPDLPTNLASHTMELSSEPGDWPETMTLQQAVEAVERKLLTQAQQRYNNQIDIAEALGVNQSTIARKLKKYGLS